MAQYPQGKNLRKVTGQEGEVAGSTFKLRASNPAHSGWKPLGQAGKQRVLSGEPVPPLLSPQPLPFPRAAGRSPASPTYAEQRPLEGTAVEAGCCSCLRRCLGGLVQTDPACHS